MSDIKLIRGQLRQIAKELLPEVMQEQQYEALKKHVDARLSEVEKYIKGTMDLMNTRQKEVLKYLLESYVGKPEEVASETPPEEAPAPKSE